MNEDPENDKRKRLGRWLRAAVIVTTAVALLIVVLDTEFHPRTDDASVRANFIEIAPEVGGRLIQLPVRDNTLVRQGELLFTIDPRDYEYALRQALSDQDNLEQRIADTKRKIAAQIALWRRRVPRSTVRQQESARRAVRSIKQRRAYRALRLRLRPLKRN